MSNYPTKTQLEVYNTSRNPFMSIGKWECDVLEGCGSEILSRLYKLSDYYANNSFMDMRINSNPIKPFAYLKDSSNSSKLKRKPNFRDYVSSFKRWDKDFKYSVEVNWKDTSNRKLVIRTRHRFKLLYQAKAFARLLNSLDFNSGNFEQWKLVNGKPTHPKSKIFSENSLQIDQLQNAQAFSYNIVDKYLHYYVLTSC